MFLKLFCRIEEDKYLKSHSKKQDYPSTKPKWGHMQKNYKPISLINMNVKIFNEILDNCIQLSMNYETIYHDQIGFSPEMQWCNIYKSIDTKYHIKRVKNENWTIISTLTEKAFTQTQCPFIMKVMQH